MNKSTSGMKRIELKTVFRGLSRKEKIRAYRELWHATSNFQILTDFPLHLDIELAGVCNLKCEHCFQNGLISEPLGFMSFSTFKAIIDEGAVKGLSAVKLQIRGESLLHRQFFDCVRYAAEAGIVDIQLTTNGTLLDEEMIEKLLASDLSGIILSVDAHHDEAMHQKYSGGFQSGTVQRSVDSLLSRRRSLRQAHPWIRIRQSVPELDFRLLERYRRELQRTYPFADIHIVGRIRRTEDDRDAFPDLHTHYRQLPCNYPNQRLAVFWNGDVTACCMDYNNRFKFGRTPDKTIQEIWNSEPLERFRRQQREGHRPQMPICRHCHVCIEPIKNLTAMDLTARNYADYTTGLPLAEGTESIA